MRRLALLIVLLALSGSGGAHGERRVIAPPGTDLGLPFSPGVLSQDFLFLSGAIGNRPGTTTVEGDAAAQVRRTLDNLGRVLEGAGLDFSRVVAAQVYLADIRHFQAMNEVYGAAFADDRPPARTTIEADIAIRGAVTEIGMVAARPGVELEWIVPEGWRPSPLYAWGVRAGDTLFLSGMVSVDPKNGEPVTGDVGRQARQVLDNVGAVLAAAGMQPRDVAACSVYLADGRDYQAMNEVYGAFFAAAPPARATVRARLAHPDLAVEIACVAVRGERRVVRPPGEEPSPRPLSAGVLAGGRLYLSGRVGRLPDGTYPHGVEAQTRVALEQLHATLAAAGLGWGDVEAANVFLADVRHYQAMNAVYAAVLPDPPPARATVGAPLMSPDALVEIQMVASKNSATGDP